jgi:hypothetical protein
MSVDISEMCYEFYTQIVVKWTFLPAKFATWEDYHSGEAEISGCISLGDMMILKDGVMSYIDTHQDKAQWQGP